MNPRIEVTQSFSCNGARCGWASCTVEDAQDDPTQTEEESLPPEAAEWLQRSLTASQAGETDAALAFFSRAAAAAPASGIPWFLRGSEHAAAQQIDAAEACFANAVLLAPAMVLARYQLGLLQFSSGRAATALLTWQALLELPPDNALPHFVRGFAALAADDFDTARRHYEQGLACSTPDNPALAGDIRKVLASFATMVPAAAETAAAATDSEPDQPIHVLFSSYRSPPH